MAKIGRSRYSEPSLSRTTAPSKSASPAPIFMRSCRASRRLRRCGIHFHVAIEVLPGKLVVDPDVSAFQHRPERLDAIGMSLSSNVFADAMLHRLVGLPQIVVSRQLVGVHRRSRPDVLVQLTLYLFLLGIVDGLRVHGVRSHDPRSLPRATSRPRPVSRRVGRRVGSWLYRRCTSRRSPPITSTTGLHQSLTPLGRDDPDAMRISA